MKVILIDDLPFEITFHQLPMEIEPDDSNDPRRFGGCTGSVDVLLDCSTPAREGEGVDSNNYFPWRISTGTNELARGTGRFKFSISLEVIHHPTLGDMLTTQIKGDFLEVMKYVFNNIPSTINTDNANLKINFEAGLKFQKEFFDSYKYYRAAKLPTYEMLLKKDNSGNVIFEHSEELSEDLAPKIVNSLEKKLILKLTVGLSCMDPVALDMDSPAPELVAAATSSNRCGPKTETRDTNKMILEEKLLTDYALVAKSGKSFACNKLFLAARSPLFKAMFQDKSRKGASKPVNLSESGVEALLQFLYCSSQEIPEGNPGVAQELLEASRELQIPTLEKAIKGIILGKPDEWIDFEGAVTLFRYCSKISGYEDMKRKAVKAMKSEPDQSKKSEFFKELCSTDSETAGNLLSFCFL